MVGQLNIKEEIITAGQHSVVGILTYGASGAAMPTIVIFNAGVIHKIGPNRLHVKLARRLAAEGFNVFRFDYGGQGDSIARTDGAASSSYITNALDLVEKKTGPGGFILTGICSGAEDAYATAMNDSRIRGVILINGTGLELDLFRKLYPEAEKSIQLRYYKKSMGKADRWLKILKGKSGALKLSKIKFIFRQLFKKAAPAKQSPAVQAMASFGSCRRKHSL
jgi:pimeloyl-ACP methyl ester carboxylesterase